MAQKNYPFLQIQIDQHRRFSRYFDGLKIEIKRNFETNMIFILFRVQVLIVCYCFCEIFFSLNEYLEILKSDQHVKTAV